MQCSWPTPDGLFRIHYDTSGYEAVYHSSEDVNPHDGIPDYVNRAADYFDLAYHAIVGGLGFDPPPYDNGEGGDLLYDIYFTDVTGLTAPEVPSDQYPGRPAYTSFIQLGHDLRIPRYGDDPYPFLRASVAHEFFHSVEFAYRAYSSDPTPWWFESCANWAEEIVFDDLNDVYYPLPAYLQALHQSLYMTAGEFMYGAWLLPEYIAERMGPAFIRNCWLRFASFDFAVTALDFELRDHGSQFNDEYCGHIVWNYFTGPNYRDGFYSEGDMFGATVYEARVHSNYPVDWVSAPIQLQNVSACYIVFRPPGIAKGDLIIEYANPTARKQAVSVAAARRFGPVEFNTYQIHNGVAATFSVRDFATTEKVIMMPAWVYEGVPREGLTTFSYRAYIDTATAIEDGNATPFAEFGLNAAYPNPFNNAVTISFNAPSAENYMIRICDIAGRAIYDQKDLCRPGVNTIDWQAPPYLASGILFYIINVKDAQLEGRITLLK
jgi:hypothetical protein